MSKFYKLRLILGIVFFLPSTALLADSAETPHQTPSDDVEEVVVLGKRQGSYAIITEDAEKLVNMPGAMGDPLGAISALPGVLLVGEDNEPAVRGSAPNDNRYFIDDMPAGYIFHQFNTSIFDENIVSDFQLYPAGFGAQYGNATGAIFDIHLRDPAQQDFSTTLTLSLLRAGVLFESQLSENSAFYLSTRMGLIKMFYPEDDEPNEDGIRVESAPEDNDYIFKYLWTPSSNKRLTVNFAGASDNAAAEFTDTASFTQANPDFAGDAALDNSFNSQSIRWDQTFDNQWQWVAMMSHYEKIYDVFWGDDYFFTSNLKDIAIKSWVIAPITDAHTVTVGTEINRSNYAYDGRFALFVCDDTKPDCESDRRDVVQDTSDIDTNFTTLYAVDHWKLNKTLELEAGLQWHDSEYNSDNSINPRLALTWHWSDTLRMNSSYGQYDRFPDYETILPVSGNPDLKSHRANHYTLGFEGDLAENWTWNIEGFYKTLSNLPLSLEEDEADAALLYANDVSGTSRGIDVFLNRNFADKWYGWISLSYTESERKNKRTGITQDYIFNTPIILNVVGNYQITTLWNAGFRFSATSGTASTEILDFKENPNFPGRYLPVYGEPYADRLPTYARLDLRFKREIMWFDKGGSFFIDIINALNRDNINQITLDYAKVAETGQLHLEKESQMGLFGSIGFSLTF